MYDLIVVGFHNQFRAAEVLNELWWMNDEWVVDLDAAVAVYRDRRGNVRYQQIVAPTVGAGFAWGRLSGSLVGALLAAPFTAAARGVVGTASVAPRIAVEALDVEWWKEEFGISDSFVVGVSRMIESGNSAIFAWIQSGEPNIVPWIQTGDPEMVVQRFRGLGGKVLRTTLTSDQSAKLNGMLVGQPRLNREDRFPANKQDGPVDRTLFPTARLPTADQRLPTARRNRRAASTAW
jgi:uncharacterized membrane protein